MKLIRLIVAVVVVSLFAALASESFGQCGRQVQQIQAAPQPAVSVFQLPPAALAQSSAITASQSASLAPAQPAPAQQAFFAPAAFVQPPAQCASGRCGGGGFLARLRANRPQTVRLTTVIRG